MSQFTSNMGTPEGDNLTEEKRPTPIPVKISGDEGRAYMERLQESLKEGTTPQFLIESNRLVGEGYSQDTDLIINYVRGVVNRLSRATTKKDSPELLIYLSDQNGSNTAVIPSAKTPILMIGLDLIDLIKKNGFGEDHLAAVLGHERFHLRRHEKWENLQNGRPEETSGDVYGLLEAEQAGYNPQAMGDMFKCFKKEAEGDDNLRYRGWGSTLGSLVAVHPEINARIRNTEVALANLQLKKRMTGDQVDIPEDVSEAAKSVRFVTRFEQYQEQVSYTNASVTEKVDFLGRYFDDVFNETDDPYLMQLHLYEASEAVQDLRGADGIKDVSWKWLEQFMQRDYESSINIGESSYYTFNNRDPYKWILGQFLMLMSPMTPKVEEDSRMSAMMNESPQGRDYRIDVVELLPDMFTRLKRDSTAFWEAETREEAIIAARNLEEARVLLRPYENGLSALETGDRFHGAGDFGEMTKDWPRRFDIRHGISEHGFFEFPWNKHLNWVLEKGDPEGSNLLSRVAKSLRCPDTRMPGVGTSWRGWGNDKGYELEDLTFDKQGRITAIPISEEERLEETRKRFKKETIAQLYASEYEIQKKREDIEDELVKTAPWKHLRNRKKLKRFIEHYAEYLQPPITVVPGRFPFAERFITELKTLAEKNPKRWFPTYYTFLVGHQPRGEKFDYNYSYHVSDEYKPDEATLPHLIHQFEYNYIESYRKNHDDISGPRGELLEDHPMYSLLMQQQDRTKREMKGDWDENGEYYQYMVEPSELDPKDHSLTVECRIDTSHPYLKALLELEPNTVYLGERAELFTKFRWKDRNADSIDGLFLIEPGDILEHGVRMDPDIFYQVSSATQPPRNMGDHPLLWSTQPMELLRTLKHLDQLDDPKRFSLSDLKYFLVTETFENDGYGDTEFWFDQDVAKEAGRLLKMYVERQVQRNKQIDFSEETSLDDVITRFKKDHGRSGFSEFTYNVFLTRPDLEQEYYGNIKERIMVLPLEERAPYLASVMESQIQDPDYRVWAVDSWIESAVMNLGLDDGSDEYKERALTFLKDSIRKMNSAQGMNCATRLLDEIQAQKAVALEGKDILVDYFGQRFLEKDGAMRAIEGAIETCAHRPELREGFLKYITEPLSEEGTSAFVKLLKSHAPQSEMVKKLFNPEKRLRMDTKQENLIIDFLHQNFWQMPFALRTVYLDRILFPVQEDLNEIFDDAVSFVLDKVLPETKKFAPEAREALLVYLDCCPPELRRTTFSAILATTEEAANSGEQRPGQVLSYVLTRTGAAGGQLLQAGHSYLNGLEIEDPDLIQFRDDLLPSKEDFDRPFRWEIFERMEEVLPEDTAEFEHTGRILGSGSTAYVVEYGSDALKIIRKDVQSIADLQFERYLESFKILAERHEHYKPLPSMVDHANALMMISTDGHIGAEQFEYAQKCYDPLKINVNGVAHAFHVADVVSCGDEYLRMERISGASINKLANDNIDPVALETSSIAIEAGFVYRLLQGKSMDQDMHGGQQGIQYSLIGMFDTGAIPYDVEQQDIDEPSSSEKRALGRLLGITLNAVMADQSPVEALVNAVTDYEWGDAKQYIVGIKRGLLARSDIHKGFSGEDIEKRNQVLKDVYRNAWNEGQIDPQIFKGVVDTISLQACRKLVVFSISKDVSQTDLNIEDQSLTDEAPVLTLSSMVGLIAQSGLKRAFSASGMQKVLEKASSQAPDSNTTFERKREVS